MKLKVALLLMRANKHFIPSIAYRIGKIMFTKVCLEFTSRVLVPY